MTTQEIITLIEKNAAGTTEEFQRLFHGRGGLYEDWRHLTVDSIDNIISVSLYFEEPSEAEFIEKISAFTNKSEKYDTLVVQRRYIKGAPSEVLIGKVPDDLTITENGMRFKLNLLSNKNSYYFPDMKNGRAFIRENAEGKHILNLFSYTCAFSVAAKLGGAKSVVNIDMSKGALKVGMANHSLNNLDPKGTSFLPYNILKSFSNIKRKGPYDIIIIDPPTFQRGSFEASKDYEKIIKKLPQIASDNCLLLACLNSPELDSDFIINMMQKFAPSFQFVKRLENVEEFKSADEARSLKNLVFIRQ
ncbi:class I SAM-dependent methyltransferase [Sulfurimonas paralvinellae]|uniref:SAM-dependent methyltransferase n=1 Tax=Sulfurimonas paralvinellae TaxID=317658 RepID=A0A7M1BAW8_9BACT|nr:class I SAM-dependent methyltransferase [Sulfurimonas paralvinellae]QOP45912.1 SAM-dependent methyltransferase [Sulfurimonas paralvinellae]